MTRRVGSAFVLTFAAQIISNLHGLVVLPLVIHTAGAATYGAYVLVNITVAQFLALLTTGIAYRYTRNLVSASDAVERRQLFEPQFNFQLIAFAVVAATCLALGPSIERLFDTGGLRLDPWLLVALVAANIIQRQVINYYRYTLRLMPYNVVVAGTTIVFVACLAVFVAVRRILSLDDLLGVQVVSSLALSLPFAIAMLREIGLPRIRMPLRLFVRDFRAGLSLTLDNIVDFAMGSGDRYLITAYLSVTDVGRYQPAYQLASVILFLPRLVVTVLSPIVSRLVDTGDRATAERVITTSLSLFLMVGVPFITGVLMIGPSLVLLLTNTDVAEASRWVAPLVAVGMVFCGILWIFEVVVIGLNRPKLILFADIKGAVVNLGLNVVLLPLLTGITVPAAATLIGYAVSAAALSLSLRRLWRLHVDWLGVLRFCVAALVMVGALSAFGFRPGEVSPVGVIRVTEGAVAGVLVYFTVLALIGGFGRKQWAEVKNLLTSRAPESGATLEAESPAGS